MERASAPFPRGAKRVARRMQRKRATTTTPVGAITQNAPDCTSALIVEARNQLETAPARLPVQTKPLDQLNLSPILSTSAFKELLAHHPDRQFADYIVNAIENGVDIGYNGIRSPYSYSNWSSVDKFSKEVSESIVKDVSLHRKIGPFTSPPSSNFMGSPMGAFQKRRSNKTRVIHDLSWPPGASVNDFISADDFTLSYMSVDDVVSKLQTFGHTNVPMAKLDLADAFHHIRVRQEDWELLGSTWVDPSGTIYYFVSTVLPFGLRSSPKLFNDFATAAKWIMLDKNVSYAENYLDDFITIGNDVNECSFNLTTMIDVCNSLGFELNPRKVTPPTPVIEFLGIVIDSVKMELRISQERLKETMDLLQVWSMKRRAKKRHLLSLIGKLTFISRVVKSGRSFLRRMIDTASSVRHLHHFVKLDADFKADLNWWRMYLRDWNGISIIKSLSIYSNFDLDLFTDASDTALAGYYKGNWFVELADKSTSINFRELRAVVLAASTWGERWSGLRIRFYCDNQAAVHIINSGTSKSRQLMNLLRSLLYYAAKYQFEFRATYLSTHTNTIADALSRLDFYRFWRLAPSANVSMTNIVDIQSSW